jgi:hypothetical protein
MMRTMRAAAVIAAALAVAPLPLAPGCAFAVDHPAVTTGIVAGTLGFGTCKLASDSYAACGLVGGGAGAFLALVTATALWLGGDGHSVLVEEPPPAALDEPRPYKPRPTRRDEPATPVPAPPAPSVPTPQPAPPAPPPQI